jgi:hypothetical protein
MRRSLPWFSIGGDADFKFQTSGSATRSTIRLVRPLVMVIKISFQFLVPSSQFVWAWPTATL